MLLKVAKSKWTRRRCSQRRPRSWGPYREKEGTQVLLMNFSFICRLSISRKPMIEQQKERFFFLTKQHLFIRSVGSEIDEGAQWFQSRGERDEQYWSAICYERPMRSLLILKHSKPSSAPQRGLLSKRSFTYHKWKLSLKVEALRAFAVLQ